MKIDDDSLSQASSYKYLGVMINGNVNWRDHNASLQLKMSKRVGLIERIGHLIPRAQKLPVVSSMIYGDVVWGERNNRILMKTLQIFHNKCVQPVGNMKPSDSSTKALDLQQWKTLDARRKSHRCVTIYKSSKSVISYTVNNLVGKDFHGIQTRSSNRYRLPKVKTNWCKQMSSYLFNDEWNRLNANIKLAANFDIFEQTVWTWF